MRRTWQTAVGLSGAGEQGVKKSNRSSWAAGWGAMWLAWVASMPVAAQESPGAPPEVEQAIRSGLVETLEVQFGPGATPQQKHWLAQAQANRARRARGETDRAQAFEQAERRYNDWIDALVRAAERGGVLDRVRVAAARTELAGLLLGGPAARELDEFELSLGRRGDRAQLTSVLERARGMYDAAQQALDPISRNIAAHEDELLAAGLYDVVQQARLDITLNLGWCYYYLGVLEERDGEQRRTRLATAERNFQELLNSGQSGPMRYLCTLALAMSQREQGKLVEAERSFAYVFQDDVAPALAAQARYELARTQLRGEKFDEARTTLRPLVDKDAEQLSADERAARFYINLAQLWDANSYLLEADASRREARNSPAATALLAKAQRSRESGLAKFRRLAQRGGPWPAVVQIYIAQSVDLRTPLGELSELELLFTASQLIDAKRYPDALVRLGEAAARASEDATLAGEILFELGRVQYLLKDERAAAEAFERLATEHASHPKAEQAATFAYPLWGKVAERSKASADYERLIASLQNLLARYANHPRRDEALWLLPVALQAAGRFEEAAAEFARVPEASRYREEAQYRSAVCRRRAVEASRGQVEGESFAQAAQRAAEALRQYARAARERAPQAVDPRAVLRWAADAQIAAGELLAGPGVSAYDLALAAVADFEQAFPESDQVGRVLAVRIRAYRGQREFERAAAIVAQYLQAAAPEQVGATLATLARGMQEEVERLLGDGERASAEALARDAVATFEELERWVSADAARAGNRDAVRSGKARMLYLAGDLALALELVEALLTESPQNGNHLFLRAQVLTAALPAEPSAAEAEAAREAWGVLLRDAAIRQRAPEQYWEARYHWLRLTLARGAAADVETAIVQERVWWPELGGEPWQGRFAELLRAARTAQGKPAEEPQPATAPAEAEPA